MKIAIIRKRYSFHGGAEGFSELLSKRLSEYSNEVHIFAINWTDEPSHPNIHLHKTPAIRFNSLLRDITFVISTFILLKRRRGYFDIIQSHDKTIYQDIYRAGDGCHIEWLRQRWRIEDIKGRLSILLNPDHWFILGLERFIFKYRRFKTVIAISEMVKRNIMDNYGVPPSLIRVVYNGVDIERFNPQNRDRFRDEIRGIYGIGGREFVILFVGSDFKRKGLRYLIEAIESMDSPVRLMVVGRGSYKGRAGDDRVIFCGPKGDVHKYYAASDIFVFPSIYEPFGNVHLEALASGLPVITTRQTGASEIIEDGRQGFIIDNPQDTETLAKKISLLIEPERRREMGIEARRLAERFSIESHVEEVMRLYQSLKG